MDREIKKLIKDTSKVKKEEKALLKKDIVHDKKIDKAEKIIKKKKK